MEWATLAGNHQVLCAPWNCRGGDGPAPWHRHARDGRRTSRRGASPLVPLRRPRPVTVLRLARRLFTTEGLRYVSLLALLVLLVSAEAFSSAEKISYGNAMYGALTTITTVGYGDITPHTSSGKIVAGVLMIVGIGFFAILNGRCRATIPHRRGDRARTRGRRPRHPDPSNQRATSSPRAASPPANQISQPPLAPQPFEDRAKEQDPATEASPFRLVLRRGRGPNATASLGNTPRPQPRAHSVAAELFA